MNNFTLSLRKYALILGMLFLTGLSFSQTTIYSEDFSSGTGGWTDVSTGSNTGDWVQGTDADLAAGTTGSYFYSQQYGGGQRYRNNTYITVTSPAIDLTGYNTCLLYTSPSPRDS